jgi:hypothetical protein
MIMPVLAFIVVLALELRNAGFVALIVAGITVPETLLTTRPLNCMNPAAPRGTTVVDGVVVGVATTGVGNGDEEDDVFKVEEVVIVALSIVVEVVFPV